MAKGTKAPSAKQRANWARFARMARERAAQARGGAGGVAPRSKGSNMAKNSTEKRRKGGKGMLNFERSARLVGHGASTLLLVSPIVSEVWKGGPPKSPSDALGRAINGAGHYRGWDGLSRMVASASPSIAAEAAIGVKRVVSRFAKRAVPA